MRVPRWPRCSGTGVASAGGEHFGARLSAAVLGRFLGLLFEFASVLFRLRLLGFRELRAPQR